MADLLLPIIILILIMVRCSSSNYYTFTSGCRVELLEQLAQRSHDVIGNYDVDIQYGGSSRAEDASWINEKFPLRLAPPAGCPDYVDL